MREEEHNSSRRPSAVDAVRREEPFVGAQEVRPFSRGRGAALPLSLGPSSLPRQAPTYNAAGGGGGAAAPERPLICRVTNSGFQPSHLRINAGRAVRFVVDGSLSHILTGPGLPGSPLLRPGQSIEHTFEESGRIGDEVLQFCTWYRRGHPTPRGGSSRGSFIHRQAHAHSTGGFRFAFSTSFCTGG